MYDLKKLFRKFGLTQTKVAKILNLDKSEIRRIVNSDNDDEKMRLWYDIILIDVDKSIYNELRPFYLQFFNSEEDASRFILEKLSYRKSNIPRRIILNIHRLISLADDIEQIRKGKECLKVFFIVVCIETLYSLYKKMKRKIDMPIDFFQRYITEDDRLLILQKVRRSLADSRFEPGERFDEKISIEIFARVVYEVRCNFAHEGNYWDFHFANDNTPVMNIVLIKERDGEAKETRIYEVSLKYSELRDICVRGFINFANEVYKAEI